ncbi:MAG: hypothetical protein JNJ99_05955 [Crocinitomicaceae bacterium]|nr:hypothetical protein [Crocinitomicaceae bacterium]
MKLIAAIIQWTGMLVVFYTIVGVIVGAFGYVLVISEARLPFIDLNLAYILLPLGLLMAVSGWMIKRKIESKEHHGIPELDVKDLSFIEKAIKKTGRRNLWVGALFCLIGTICFLALVYDPKEISLTGQIIIIIFGILFLLIGLLMLSIWSRLLNVRQTKEWNLIMMEPHKINQVKIEIYQNEMGKVNQAISMTFIVENKLHSVLHLTEQQMHLMIQYLNEVNPAIQYLDK